MMGRMLLKSQTHRSRYAQLSDRYAGWFVSVVLTLAGLTAWWWLRHDASMAFPATLAVLVISCPCALSLATPAAIASASRALLDRGILLTRGTALEMMGGIDTIVFDKTGTLTTGQPTVVRTVLNPDRRGIDAASALRIAALLEIDSSHPVAHAFVGVPVNRTDVCDVVNQGIGVQGRVGDTGYKLGNAMFTNINHDSLPGGEGALWLVDDEGWIARFDLDDGLRVDVANTIQSLERKGLDLIILSGDAAHAVGAIARRIGVYQWHAEQSPKMKMDYLAYLQASGKKVLMVGDGINDALVLSVADVSMTVSGATELANSTADFILTGDSLSLVNDAFATAERTRKVIQQNLTWALGYNLLAIPFAAAGLIEPWMAAIGMSVSSLVVVLNSGRLARGNNNHEFPDTGVNGR
jgi:Cu2+-exporting ATPase